MLMFNSSFIWVFLEFYTIYEWDVANIFILCNQRSVFYWYVRVPDDGSADPNM
jgi:hypothetical protein